MKVCLLSDAILPPLTGIGRYAWELAQGIEKSRLITDRRYLGYRGTQTFAELQAMISMQSVRAGSGELAISSKVTAAARLRQRLINWRFVSEVYQAKQTFEYKRHLVDCNDWIVHGPNYHLPAKVPPGAKRVVTVHDLSTFVGPHWHPAERVRRMNSVLPKALAVADKIITDATFCAERLIADFGVERSRVQSIPLGVDSNFFVTQAVQRGAYTLCVSTIEPRKNIASLLRSYRTLPEAVLRVSPLVLVGEYGWRSADEHAAIRDGLSQGWLVYRGYVSEPELIRLYQNARLCVYPSIHEGFGLPILEAFAAGAPVIAGNHTSIPEVSGGHARLLQDATDIDEMRDAIISELTAPWDAAKTLARSMHAQQYRWDRTVELTIEAYRSVA